MTVSLSCFLFEGAAYNIIFLRRILPTMGKESLVLPFGILFNLIWGVALWSYVVAHLTDPGRLPKRWEEFVTSVGDALPIAPPRQEWQPGKATFCDKCDIPRPERAHHCGMCKICVLRMDHHCAWIDNCVGFNNHKFFCLLVIYACAASILALITSLPELICCAFSVLGMEDILPQEAAWGIEGLHKTDILGFLIFGILAFFFMVLLVPMVHMHVPLAKNNETAIESNYSNMPNPFDQGSCRANLETIFGEAGLDWLLPIKPWKPVCDGITFAPRSGTLDSLVDPLASEPTNFDDDDATRRWWKARYNVRKRETARREDSVGAGPLSSFAAWWSGAPARDNSITQAAEGPMTSRRELTLQSPTTSFGPPPLLTS